MIKIRQLTICLLLLLAGVTLHAQSQKSLNAPAVVKYLRGGYAKDGKLHLVTNADYKSLSKAQKQEVLNRVAGDFQGYDISVYAQDQQRELWLSTNQGVKMLETWHNDSLQIADYQPLQLKRHGLTKVFYYVGGSYNGGDGFYNGALNLRAGTYLYKNLIDAAVTLNMGGSKVDGGDSEFTGDVGIDSRFYLPFRIKNVNLAPYVGAGVSWIFAPEKMHEFRLLTGACWFIGPGSLDFGLQWGSETDFALTVGYTFRIPLKHKK